MRVCQRINRKVSDQRKLLDVHASRKLGWTWANFPGDRLKVRLFPGSITRKRICFLGGVVVMKMEDGRIRWKEDMGKGKMHMYVQCRMNVCGSCCMKGT